MLLTIKICAIISLISAIIAFFVSAISVFSYSMLCIDLLLVCCCSLMWSLYFMAKRKQNN